MNPGKLTEYITIKVYDTQNETDMGDVIAVMKDVNLYANINQMSGPEMIHYGMDLHDEVYKVTCRKEFTDRPMELVTKYGTLKVTSYREKDQYWWAIIAKKI